MNRVIVGAVGALVACGLAQAQLSNSGFETAGAGTVFSGWSEQGNVIPNIVRDSSNPHAGSFAAKLFGQFTPGAGNDTGVFQSLPASPGDIWEASVYAAHFASDPLVGSENVGFMSLLFLDGVGNVLADIPSNVVTPATATGSYVQHMLSGAAPLGTAEVQVFLGFHQGPVEPRTGSVFYDSADLQLTGTGEPDFNGSFEIGAVGQPPAYWNHFGNSIGNVVRDAITPLDGEYVCKIFGQFWDIWNDSGIYQNKPANPGEIWEAKVSARHNSDDPIVGSSLVVVDLLFLNSSFQTIAAAGALQMLDAGVPTDVWTEHSLQMEAPAGTAYAQIVLVFVQDNMFSPGAALFDLASLEVVSEPCIADFNGDGILNGVDVGLFLQAYATFNPASGADLNNDGFVNGIDVGLFLQAYSTGC